MKNDHPITHKGAFLAVAGLFWMAIVYAFLVNHQIEITGSRWEKYLDAKVTHDDGMWFYNGISTCVQYYGTFDSDCDKSIGVCAGGKVYGGYEEQSKAVNEAIKNNGVHPRCPLVYYGTD